MTGTLRDATRLLFVYVLVLIALFTPPETQLLCSSLFCSSIIHTYSVDHAFF